MEDTPHWGIEPGSGAVARARAGSGRLPALGEPVGLSLLVIVAGAFALLPASEFGLALSLPEALGAIAAAAVVGSLMLGLGGLIGADARVPTMVLLRAPLGRRGSYLPTGLNILQCLGWSVFELIVIATGASALSKHVLGFGGTSFWKILFGAVATLLALLGPVGFVRAWVRRFAVWVVIASLGYLSWWTLHGAHLSALWAAPGRAAARLLARRRPHARDAGVVAAARGRLHALLAEASRRVLERHARLLRPDRVAVRARGDRDVPRGLGEAPAVLTAVAAGGAASAVALLALGVDETKEAFANVYSGAVSLQNVVPGVSQRLLILATAAVSTGGACSSISQVRELPAPARVVLRAAVRRPARRLAARGAQLPGAGRVRRARLPDGRSPPGSRASALYQWL